MIKLTERAKKYLLNQKQKENKNILFLNLKKYGCSGYAYDLKWEENEPLNSTLGSQLDEFNIFYNNEHADKLEALEIDLEQQGLNKMIVFNNPLAKAHCGCGASVSFEH